MSITQNELALEFLIDRGYEVNDDTDVLAWVSKELKGVNQEIETHGVPTSIEAGKALFDWGYDLGVAETIAKS